MYLGEPYYVVLKLSRFCLSLWVLNAPFSFDLPVVLVKPSRSALHTVGIFRGVLCFGHRCRNIRS